MMDFDDSSRRMSRVNIHDKRHIHHQNHTKCKNPSKQNKRRDGCIIIPSIHDQRPKTSTPKVNVSPNQIKTRHPRPKLSIPKTQNKKLEHKRQKEGEITFINVTRVRFLSSLGSFLLISGRSSSLLACLFLLCGSFSGGRFPSGGRFLFSFRRHFRQSK
jgi:hypothetical protein